MLFYLRCVHDVVTGMMFWLTLCFDWHDVLIDTIGVSDIHSVGQTFTMQDPICNVCRASCLELCKFIRLYLSQVLRQDLLPLLWPPALMTTHRPARPSCGTGRLQSVHNNAARLVLNSPSSFLLKSFHIRDIRPLLRLSRYQHMSTKLHRNNNSFCFCFVVVVFKKWKWKWRNVITPPLNELNWLPVQRGNFHNTVPSYLPASLSTHQTSFLKREAFEYSKAQVQMFRSALIQFYCSIRLEFAVRPSAKSPHSVWVQNPAQHFPL